MHCSAADVVSADLQRADQLFFFSAFLARFSLRVNCGSRLPLGFAFKVLGVEWKETSDLVIAFMWLEKLGLVESKSLPNDPESLVIRRRIINR